MMNSLLVKNAREVAHVEKNEEDGNLTICTKSGAVIDEVDCLLWAIGR